MKKKKIDISNKNVNSLTFSLGVVIEELFGKYNSVNDEKYEEYLGLNKGAISKLVIQEKINEKDFNVLCNYLNPTEELKSYWLCHYVIMNEVV